MMLGLSIYLSLGSIFAIILCYVLQLSIRLVDHDEDISNLFFVKFLDLLIDDHFATLTKEEQKEIVKDTVNNFKDTATILGMKKTMIILFCVTTFFWFPVIINFIFKRDKKK